MEPTRVTVRSNLPTDAVARYGVIGSPSCQTHVRLPAEALLETSRPFAITVRSSLTVTAKSYVALSPGLSFAGYQPGEPCGSPTTNAPSFVGTQPSIASSGSVITDGSPT